MAVEMSDKRREQIEGIIWTAIKITALLFTLGFAGIIFWLFTA